MYSPSEIKAYEDRFPNCKHVEIKVYNDGSSNSECLFSAFGDENGSYGSNVSDKCFLCSCYEERTGEIKVVDLSNHLDGEIFEPLKKIEYFKTVKVNPEFETIYWENGADIAPEFLFDIGK